MPRRNLPSLSLYVPEPRFRPGDEADFAGFDMPVAGAVARPDVATKAAGLRDMAYRMVRVLDDEGRPQGPWAPRLDTEKLIRMVVPHLYAWKSVKWARGIEYMVGNRRGFWEERGYHTTADPWREQRYSYQEE